MRPLVSVVMPAYNAEKYISEAVESVLCQTYKNFELIVVEDASTDGTLDVIKTYKDKRIKLFCNPFNQGIAETTNRGIRESRGTYIALLDDDDIAEADRLSLQVDYMETHTEIDILGGRTILINERGEIMDYSNEPRRNPRYIKAVLLFGCLDFWNGTAMIRKNFIEKHHLYYRNNCYGMQDYRFYMESSKVGNISSISRFLLRHRLHKENNTEQNFCRFSSERAQAYAQLQRESLQKSGFQLTENALALINKTLAEKNGGCESVRELEELYHTFCELLSQGRAMGIDYLDELEHVCKVKMAGQLLKTKHFFKGRKGNEMVK